MTITPDIFLVTYTRRLLAFFLFLTCSFPNIYFHVIFPKFCIFYSVQFPPFGCSGITLFLVLPWLNFGITRCVRMTHERATHIFWFDFDSWFLRRLLFFFLQQLAPGTVFDESDNANSMGMLSLNKGNIVKGRHVVSSFVGTRVARYGNVVPEAIINTTLAITLQCKLTLKFKFIESI